MKKFAIALAAAGLTLGLIPASAHAAEYDAFGAYCHLSGDGKSRFTANASGTYYWVWRTGYTVLGAGKARLSAGSSKTLNTPAGSDSTTRFGVLTSTAMTYAYVTCS